MDNQTENQMKSQTESIIPVLQESVSQKEQPVIIGEPLVNGYTTILKCSFAGSKFKEFTKSLTALTPEVRLHIDNDAGLLVCAVDTANTAMVRLNYHKHSFPSYKAIGTHAIGIDLPVWSKFLKNVKKDMIVFFEVVQHELPLRELNEKEKLRHTDERVVEYDYTYKLSCAGNTRSGKCLNANTVRRDPNAPAIPLGTKISLYAGEFIDTIKSVAGVSDKIVFIYKELPSEPIFKAIAEGGTSKNVKEISTTMITGEGCRSIFSLVYLLDITKAIQNRKEIITIDMDNDRPMKIILSDDSREIIYLLAPWIECN
jgi:hypothetical protein